MFALIDCNNFFASCERVFRPDLINTPIVVLSNNDGCCIARSNEAKALGIAMGVPYFQIQHMCRQHGIKVFSSNYTLYGNISQRVMNTIEASWPHVEFYSIDEAFLDLSSMPTTQHESFCRDLQKKILKHVGIPTSIGIGKTKTLAKVANHLCKKVLHVPVVNITHQMQLLKHIDVGEVWGIGRSWDKKLRAQGIHTAYDLSVGNPQVLKRQFNVVLMRTAMELCGVSCGGLEDATLKQNIMSSKSFGTLQTDEFALAQAVSSHCARAVDKMRQQGLIAHRMSVFVCTPRFRQDLAYYAQSIETHFVNPVDDVRIITKRAKECVQRLFKPGYFYKKVGVCLHELIPKTTQQLDLFEQPNEAQRIHAERLMNVLDQVNQKYGRSTLRLAAEGYAKPWAMRSELKSPAYMSRWSELPKVRVY
ncbi:MAG: Y-family DNA polymerase [Legionella sp.]|uniref:Y-family DNA polymerase n=1 Tax=Legionella sp. TaxID=459 RepID=UPI0039E2D9E5